MNLRSIRRATVLAGSCSLLTLLASPRTASAACGDGTFEPEAEECDDGNTIAADGCDPSCRIECTEVGAAATEHTCLHGSFGPFITLAAQAFPGFVYSEVSTPHTYFTVQLGGEQNVGHRAVVFAPNATGAFAIYMKSKFPLVVRDSSGAPVPEFVEHAISGCAVPDALVWVKTFKVLDESETYTLDVLSIVESILDDVPAQTRRSFGEGVELGHRGFFRGPNELVVVRGSTVGVVDLTKN